MEREWSPVIAWFCLGLFALAEFGNIQMTSEISRVCALAVDGPVLRAKSVVEEVGAICANRVPDDNYRVRLAARQAHRN
jgi:hypothetical protein